MRTESKLLLGLGLFFLAMGIVYWLWSGENGGGMMIVCGALLGFLPGSYYWFWSRKMRQRASDDPNATIAQGSGVVDTFPGATIFPFILGCGAFFAGLALVFGAWFGLVAAALVIWAMVGAVSESRRGSKSPDGTDVHAH